MFDSRDVVVVLYLAGGVATGAALVISVVSIALSVRAATRRPGVAEDVNMRYQARRTELLEGLDERGREAMFQGDTDEMQSVREAVEDAEARAREDFAAEFARYGMVPHTWDNMDVQRYQESAWQVQQSLKPQVVSAALLVVGIGLQTWASIWALSLPAAG